MVSSFASNSSKLSVGVAGDNSLYDEILTGVGVNSVICLDNDEARFVRDGGSSFEHTRC